MKFTIFLEWNDKSETNFEVTLNGEEHEYMSTLMWITRGSLICSRAKRAIAYNEEGFDIVSYIQ